MLRQLGCASRIAQLVSMIAAPKDCANIMQLAKTADPLQILHVLPALT